MIVSGLLVLVAGCQEPKEIAPVAPPGFELARVPVNPQGEPAQALGEQAANKEKPPIPNAEVSPPTPIGKPVTKPSGLIYETLTEGTGETAKPGQTVTIHYTGSLPDGTVFDSSRGREPFVVNSIGAGRVITGWNVGVPGMKVGERRKLTIPPSLGYGASGSPPKIPGDATLIFDLELLKVQ
jgi:FKBP-type peptidyl-prolyl cis-trans isomerase